MPRFRVVYESVAGLALREPTTIQVDGHEMRIAPWEALPRDVELWGLDGSAGLIEPDVIGLQVMLDTDSDDIDTAIAAGRRPAEQACDVLGIAHAAAVSPLMLRVAMQLGDSHGERVFLQREPEFPMRSPQRRYRAEPVSAVLAALAAVGDQKRASRLQRVMRLLRQSDAELDAYDRIEDRATALDTLAGELKILADADPSWPPQSGGANDKQRQEARVGDGRGKLYAFEHLAGLDFSRWKAYKDVRNTIVHGSTRTQLAQVDAVARDLRAVLVATLLAYLPLPESAREFVTRQPNVAPIPTGFEIRAMLRDLGDHWDEPGVVPPLFSVVPLKHSRSGHPGDAGEQSEFVQIQITLPNIAEGQVRVYSVKPFLVEDPAGSRIRLSVDMSGLPCQQRTAAS